MADYQVHGCSETVYSVTDLARVARLYSQLGGWSLAHQGRAAPGLAAFWNLPAETRIEEFVVAPPDEGAPVLRLVKFHGLPQQQIRSSARTWDPGGLFDVDVFVHDVDAALRDLQGFGYNAYSDPVTWQFGPLTVRHVLVQIDDGICHAMIQRVAPPFDEAEANFKGYSPIFNSSQIVDDLEPSHSFFTEILGFEERFHETWSHAPQDGENIFGLPANTARDLEGHAIGYHPKDGDGGALEIVWLKGVEGRDFAERAVPPNLGILMQRFPVENLDGFVAELKRKGVPLVAGPAEFHMAEVGDVHAAAIRSPNGSWLEFYEK